MNGPLSISSRAASAEISSRCAIASVICSTMDAAIRCSASRAGPEYPCSVNRSAALLYSSRLPTWNSTPSLSSAPAVEPVLHADPGQPEVTGWLQVDPVERGGQVVRHVPRREVAERLGPGHGELAGAGERADRGAQLLDLGQAHPLPADLGHQRPDPVVGARPAQPVQHVGQPRPPHRGQRRQRVGGRFLRDPVAQVQFEDQRSRPPLAERGDPVGQRRSHHASSLRPGREPGSWCLGCAIVGGGRKDGNGRRGWQWLGRLRSGPPSLGEAWGGRTARLRARAGRAAQRAAHPARGLDPARRHLGPAGRRPGQP